MPELYGSADNFIKRQLNSRLGTLEETFKAHVITFCGGLLFGVDDLIRGAVEKRCQQKPLRRKLVVILSTGGGYIEVVQRIVSTLRQHYRLVDFVVPNYAFSAGTVLVMSGDAIYMDYYSRLGPIDPQVQSQGGRDVPALGYLERYNELIIKAHDHTITNAEVQLLVDGFDQAELYQYDHARQLSIALLKDWLVKYKFKSWKITRTRKIKVTKAMKVRRAEEIAEKLNDTKRWHLHGHGISMAVLERDVKLLIDDFGKDRELSKKVRGYHDLLADYMTKRRTRGVIHSTEEYLEFM
jgi:hypothetical protein